MDMERRGKRSIEQLGREDGWRRDQDLPQKLDREQEEQRRKQYQRDSEAQRRWVIRLKRIYNFLCSMLVL
jgi:hypothetical protein